MPDLVACLETLGANEAIPVFGLAVDDTDRVNHAVTIERVVAAYGFMNLVLGIANVNTINIFRNLADDFHKREKRIARAATARLLACGN